MDINSVLKAHGVGKGGMSLTGHIKELPIASGEIIKSGDLVDIFQGEIIKAKKSFISGKTYMFRSTSTSYHSLINLTNTISLLCYGYNKDGNSGWACIVSTASGTPTILGDPIKFHSSYVCYVTLCKLQDNKIFLAYSNGNDKAYARILNISNNTISSMSSPFVFYSLNRITYYLKACRVNNNKVALTFTDRNYSGYIYTLNINGDTITTDNSTSYKNDYSQGDVSSTMLTDSLLLVVYGSYNTYAKLFNIQAGSITQVGSEVYIKTKEPHQVQLERLNSTQALLICRDADNHYKNLAILLDSSNSTITQKHSIFFGSDEGTHFSLVKKDNTFVIFYHHPTNNENALTLLAIEGNQIIENKERNLIFSKHILGYASLVSLSESELLLAFNNDDGNTNSGNLIKFDILGKGVGIARENGVGGQIKKINVWR